GVDARDLDARDRVALGPRPDDVGLVAEAQDEAAHAEAGVVTHEMPEDGLAADGDHRFRDALRAFAEPGTPAAAEHDSGHVTERDGARHGRPDYRRGARPAGTVASTMNSLYVNHRPAPRGSGKDRRRRTSSPASVHSTARASASVNVIWVGMV